MNILILSSLPTYWSGGLGKDMVDSLRIAGHDVDFITKFGYKDQEDFVYNIYKQPLKEKFRKFSFLVKCKRYFCKITKRKNSSSYISSDGIRIVNINEQKPPVPTSFILKKISKHYDCVITLFWEYMMSADTLLGVYRLLGCPVIIYSVDMFPMTGGCYYFHNCRNFEHGCGRCPALNSDNPKDETAANFSYKKHVYSQINCAFVGNTWMNKHAHRSGLFKESRIFNSSIVLNEELYKPYLKGFVRPLLNIFNEKSFVMLVRYFGKDNVRKGYSYLKEAIAHLCKWLTEEEKNKMLIVFIGEDDDTLQNDFDITVCNKGKLSVQNLVYAYSAADIFLSPTVVDAGPSMVNQALLCGTPVVSFDLGTAVDVVVDKKTGYKAKYKDPIDFANGIYYFYKRADAPQVSKHCREMGLKMNSRRVFSSNIEHIYRILANGNNG